MFVIFFHILAQNAIKMGFWWKNNENPISLYFCTETDFRDFCEDACHYDVTEAKLWYLIGINV